MVTVTYVDMGGFIQSVEGTGGSHAADLLAEQGEDVRTIKNVHGNAAQQQAFWRRLNDRNNVSPN